jgi:hypothetical protein
MLCTRSLPQVQRKYQRKHRFLVLSIVACCCTKYAIINISLVTKCTKDRYVSSVGVTPRCSVHQRASSLCSLVSCFPQARNWCRFSPPCLCLCCISHIRPIYFSEASFIATSMMCTFLQPTRSYTNPCLLNAILVNSFENFLVHDSIAFLKQVSLQHV